MALHSISITNQLDWLHTANSTLGLPAGYEAYVKVLPPIGIDPAVPIDYYSFAANTVAELNERAAFWNKYGIQQGRPAIAHLQRTTYRAVGASLGLAASAPDATDIVRFYGTWPPHLGSSPALEVEFIQQLIQAFGAEQPAYFSGSVDEGNYHWSNDGFPQDWLEQGVLADLQAVYQRDGVFPTYIFPPDHAWCMYQGEDIDWLAVGGSVALTGQLLHHSELEATLVSPSLGPALPGSHCPTPRT